MFISVNFYVVWGILAVIPLMFAVFYPQTIKKKIIACLCALVVACGFTILIYKNNECAIKRWNNGVCECGGTYNLTTVSQYKFSKSFYYVCSECGHTEQFSHLMK